MNILLQKDCIKSLIFDINISNIIRKFVALNKYLIINYE